MTEHTPGPWLLGSEQSRDEYALCVNRKTISGRIDSVARACSMDSPEEAEANARLIAAAPNLLIALEKLVAADNCNYEAQTMRNSGYFDLARTAIAKAQL
ncbi:hypothetical protein LCGC14_0960790 [marine sediment metagenome]|uniref:Uncharacterized protein n=1 Tax=marine sediment metagenome TaxID=412755 RepID=A0A0F9RL31_9ZZZZ